MATIVAPVLTHPYRCHGRIGNLQGLERDAKALTEALRRAYGDGADCDARADDPDPDTRAVYEEVRAALLALSLGTAG